MAVYWVLSTKRSAWSGSTMFGCCRRKAHGYRDRGPDDEDDCGDYLVKVFSLAGPFSTLVASDRTGTHVSSCRGRITNSFEVKGPQTSP
jgi:hypothetical protein